MQNQSILPVNRKILISSILIGITLLVYSQVSHYPFINFDDAIYVFNNSNIQAPISPKSIAWAFTTFQAANWHPLTWLSHILDFQLFGLNAGGHHLTSLFIHLLNTILLFLVLEKMTGGFWQSALVAALFAIHPLHVESVVWISERKDVLSTFFWILTMWVYLFYIERPAVFRYLLVLFTFSLGLLSKPMVVTLPFVLLLLDYWPLGRYPDWALLSEKASKIGESPRFNNKTNFSILLIEKIPFLLLSAASSIITFYAQQSAGAVNQLLPISARISNALVSYLTYLGKMLLPFNLSIFYPYQAVLPIWQTIGSGLLLGVLLFWIFRKWNQYPYLAVGWLWYLGTLVPVIGLVQVGSQSMADRYTYLPFIGIFIMIAWGMPDLLSRFPYRKITLWIMTGVLLPVLMALSWIQVGYWQNSISLFQHALKMSSRNVKAHDMLGFTLMEQGKLDQAMIHFREAIKIKPNYGSAYNNLGVALEKKGKINDAMVQYLNAIRVQPGLSEAHYNLGVIMTGQGKLEAAISYFQAALRINKKYAEAYNNLGVVVLKLGRIEEAINYNSEALKIKPFYANAHYNLANALACAGRIDEAVQHFEAALKIDPNYEKARNNLRMILVYKGKKNEVITTFKKALIIYPDSLKADRSLQSLLQERRKEK